MKTDTYGEFWQRIHSSARRKEIPLRVMFELTYRCNFKCRHCYVPENYREKGELETKEVFSILDQLKEIGCFYLGFTGGEPFMREDIIDILWYAKRCGFEVIVYTNGSLIDEKTAKELKRIRPNKVDITIPGMTKDAFEGVTGVEGSRDKVFGAIELLHKNGIDLGFKTCLLKENESEIKEIEDFARSLGALHRLDNMLSPRLDGVKTPFELRGSHLVSPISKIAECTIENSVSNHEPRITNHEPLFRCGVGQSQAAITPLGELKMCLMIDELRYKITDNGLKDAWVNLKHAVASIKPDENYKCGGCELEPYCKWCPARAWLYNRTFTSCEPESRSRAEEIKLKEQYV